MKTYYSLFLAASLGLASTHAADSGGLGVGELCKRTWNANAGGDGKYQDNNNDYKCGDGLVCLVEEGDTGDAGEVEGTCVADTCGGQKDTSGNGPVSEVTICHRTCSETNPWVRITIDDDAWNGTLASGCGHEQQHDIWDECANKAPWEAWGSNHKDYLIKWHGTRDQVGESLSTQEEKAYWKFWEPACPYVRGEGCCDWATGSCCGDEPNVKRCGDGTMDEDLGETCDDGNIIDGDGCSSTCQLEANPDPFCGDGNVDEGEECDGGIMLNGLPCRDNCRIPVCGDGILDEGEECDGGIMLNGLACSSSCIIETVESSTTEEHPNPGPFCGDGNVDEGEECDGGIMLNGLPCRDNCRIPVCGDGILDEGEECDGGIMLNGLPCRDNCRIPVCGDGILDEGEECDGGIMLNGLPCRENCFIPVCGDGILDEGEECDGGIMVNGLACSSNCIIETVESSTTEEQSNPGSFCGDGNVDEGEECDGGIMLNGLPCRDNCRVPVCGDSILDEGEECDGGIMVNGLACSSSCTIEQLQVTTEEDDLNIVPNASPNVCAGSVHPIVTLLHKSDGSENPPVDLVKVLKTDYTSEGAPMVQFQLQNTFAQVINQFFVQFHEQVIGAAYNDKCYGANNVPANTIMSGAPFEAVCLVHNSVTIVNVWVVDNGVGSDFVPDCCHGDKVAAVQYTFHLLCECPMDAPARALLRGGK
jgi:cysteine-rich repeat protein